MRIAFVAALLAAALLASGGSPPSAGAATLTGTFVEKGASTPLAAVEVVLRHAADSGVVAAHAATGSDGRFHLDRLRLGRYLLRASLLGHEPFRREVTLVEAAPVLDLGTVALAVIPIPLKGVAVTTERATAIVAPDRNIYLAKDLSAAATTATDVLRAVPELDVDINGNVSLRGSGSVKVQFNGRNAPLQGQALATFLQQTPASRIERVEVIANPSAKFDPEGGAGIINLVLKDKTGLGLSGSVNLVAGTSYDGPGARVNWQRGPLTLFGGFTGIFSHYNSNNDLRRQGLPVESAGSFASVSQSHSRSRYGTFDLSADYALTKRSTLYGTVNAYQYGSDNDALSHALAADSTQAPTSCYDRTDAGSYGYGTGSVTLGLEQIVEQNRNQRSIEFLQTDSGNDNDVDGLQCTQVPIDLADQVYRQEDATGYHERSVQVDDMHPLGAKGKLEAGYRGAERWTTESNRLRYFLGDSLIDTPLSGASDYSHREIFHSGYATLGRSFGHLSVQIGARAEAARSTFDVRTSGHRYAYDYRSLFPSANVAWDFGKGRILRFSYSKRIERPQAYQLNPEVPTTDSLNRFVGNPSLGPRYTHSYSLDASWSGSRGLLRLSPYLRETVDSWDYVTRVDPAGAAVSTWLNASSIRYFGVSLTGSLRQTKRLGGTASLSVFREHHDAGNLSSEFRHEATNWSANANVTCKVTRGLDAQVYLRYSPAQTLAQGRSDAYCFLMAGFRQKLGDKGSINLGVRDPFAMARWGNETGDATYAQRTTWRNNMRGLVGQLIWTWGKEPQQKQRRQSAEQPQQQETPGRQP